IPCTVTMGTLVPAASITHFPFGRAEEKEHTEVNDLSFPLAVRQPPTIVTQSPKDHIVDPKDTMVIECEAKGNPQPIFSWRRNGKYYNVARDPQASMRRRSGTLDIYAWKDPQEYEAEYQCIASNEHGSAYSNKILLRLSRPPLWPNEILEPVVVSVGFPLVLSCDPPRGPPRPETYWMSSCECLSRAVRQDRRVSTGINGDLYFSNVLFNDSHTDYCCNARLPHKHSIQQKRPVVVKVITTRTVSEAAPTWLSPIRSSSSVLVLQGEELLLECIAAGVPTPHITWTKDGEKLVVKPGMRIKNFNKMIHIPKASFDDIGEYVCSAANKIGYTERTIIVQVKAAPFWLEKPVDLVLAPEENGALVCRSDGIPRPTIRWFINGEALDTALPHPSRHMSGDTLSFRGVTMENTGVYQCNASNQFGYLLANAYVNVLHATPRIIPPQEEHLKVVEGSNTFLECRYFGSPVPDLFPSPADSGLHLTHSNGTLEIKQIRLEDTGTYMCIVTNIAGRDESQIRVEVKEPTLFVSRPQNLKVLRGSDVTFECGVKADASTPVTTTWLKNKRPLSLNWRISLDESNLVITTVNSADDGEYTCSIKTEMDEKSASARLMVMGTACLSHETSPFSSYADRPNPPTNLQLSDPHERSVRLSWVPGDHNHSPITEYQVQYDEDDWLPGKWRNLSTYPGNLNSVILQLTPYTYYEFRVIAVNAIGPSRPSRVSSRLQTGGAPPDVIPRNIRGVGTWRNNMEISWEWNGPYLKYLVWWKRKDSREEWKNATTKWLRYYIYDADTFTPYEIKVQAFNSFGLGPESKVIIGYSGEDRPSTAPLNLRVSDIESTQVTLHWDPVARNSLMGELKEYKVYYWRDSSQLRWLSVSRAMKSKGFPAVDTEYTGVLDELLPYSNYKMHIVVANNRYDGPPSHTIQFSTPEGVPSVPKSFRIQQRHLDTIYVDWALPAEPNGIITGYTLKYQTVNATRGEEMHVEEFYSNVTSFSVRRYDRYTRYRFSLAAKTQVGLGEWHTEESAHYTTEGGCSVLYPEYNSARTSECIMGRWSNRLTHSNTHTDTHTLVSLCASASPAYATDQVDLSTKGWLIGIMCAVAIIVLFLLIVCFIKRSRGGKYPVREKKEISLEPVDDKDQEGTFDYREEERGLQRGQASVEPIMKRTESDDSLVDYGDVEIQFNEDGSFIGEYTGTSRKDAARDARDVRDEMDYGGNMDLHSTMNAIYSMA
uniref:Neurofascin n=1 Tax=Gadus morhua TaxID=8049 RepID=A0A8C5C685_GADMO